MRLLAIDTALEDCSVGLSPGEGPTIYLSETIGRGHAERLFGMIAAAVAEARLDLASLDRIAVTVGPGSFTGVRVGIAAARGLALVIGCPVVGIGTLEAAAALARDSAGPVPVLAVLDARRGEVYGQAFAGGGMPLGSPVAASPAHFAAMIVPGMVVAGSGADLVTQHLPEGAPVPVIHRRASPDIGAVLRLGAAAPLAGRPPRPLYVRAPDAKPQTGGVVARR